MKRTPVQGLTALVEDLFYSGFGTQLIPVRGFAKYKTNKLGVVKIPLSNSFLRKTNARTGFRLKDPKGKLRIQGYPMAINRKIS